MLFLFPNIFEPDKQDPFSHSDKFNCKVQWICIKILSSWNTVFSGLTLISEILWVIWYHLCNLKNVKNTHEGVLLLVKLQTETCYFTKSNIPSSVFFTFCNGSKSRKASQLVIRARSLVVSDLWPETKGSRYESRCCLCAEVSSQQ